VIPALLLAFIVVPIAEIAVVVKVGSLIGVVPTVVLLLAESLLGAWIVKREGGRAWRALREAVGSGRMPDRELADGALVLVGGTLLLTPGFITDVVGFFLVLPFTRPLARAALYAVLARRVHVVRIAQSARTWRGSGAAGSTPGRSPRVVPGQLADDDPH
jgi:UPF0716 protein FxsA